VLDRFSFEARRRHDPKDDVKYIIPFMAVGHTEKVLREYGAMESANEGIVYWGGTKNQDTLVVKAVIAPQTVSDWGMVRTSHRSNVDFVRALNRYNLVQVAQVHSHPSSWVDHSMGDDALAAFRTEGLISIVVPEYCSRGMTPLERCGVHRYTQGNFIRLSSKYVRGHFTIQNDLSSLLVDLRK
jgi:hypothetical protein